MNSIEDLKPRKKLFVMDLVKEAGIDVSDWANFQGGIRRARTNPKYCYEWAFSNNSVTVLNIWYDSISYELDEILLRSNLRLTSESSSTKGIWKSRANKFDRHVQSAYQNKHTVRVIINDGYRREGNLKTEKASKVNLRLLDSMPWIVASYDNISGEFVLSRGIKLIDQFDIESNLITPSEKHSVAGEVFFRNPEVRKTVLKRANGKCEFCGARGFKTLSGELFLETHHIVPLSQGGPDTIYNVAGICPNHHREAHFGDTAEIIRDTLLGVISRYYN